MVLAYEQVYRYENRTETNLQCQYGQLLLHKGARAYKGVKTVSLINGAGRTRLVHAEK